MTLTILVPAVAAIRMNVEPFSAFLVGHGISPGILRPLGIPLILTWAILYFLNELLVRTSANAARGRWVSDVNIIHGKTAGNVEDLTVQMRKHRGGLPEDVAKKIVRSFLARIVDYAVLFVNEPGVDIRACCFVLRSEFVPGRPGRPAGNRPFLVTWEFDAPHQHIGEQRVEMGQPLAGHVAQNRQPMIVEDVCDSKNKQHFAGKRYRTVLGLPLMVGPNRLIGVVTIDANKPRVFSRYNEAGRLIEDASSPILAAIALVLEAVVS